MSSATVSRAARCKLAALEYPDARDPGRRVPGGGRRAQPALCRGHVVPWMFAHAADGPLNPKKPASAATWRATARGTSAGPGGRLASGPGARGCSGSGRRPEPRERRVRREGRHDDHGAPDALGVRPLPHRGPGGSPRRGGAYRSADIGADASPARRRQVSEIWPTDGGNGAPWTSRKVWCPRGAPSAVRTLTSPSGSSSRASLSPRSPYSAGPPAGPVRAFPLPEARGLDGWRGRRPIRVWPSVQARGRS